MSINFRSPAPNGRVKTSFPQRNYFNQTIMSSLKQEIDDFLHAQLEGLQSQVVEEFENIQILVSQIPLLPSQKVILLCFRYKCACMSIKLR